MTDTIQKILFRVQAGVPDSEALLKARLNDSVQLSINGLNGELVYITGMEELNKKAVEIEQLYNIIPEFHRYHAEVLLDANASATIEGARTTVEHVKNCIEHPKTKDEKMVVNTYKACMFAYDTPIDLTNIRELWDIIVKDVCENADKAGTLFRNGMVYVGNASSIIHTPAPHESVSDYMKKLQLFMEESTLHTIIKTAVFHFFFVYIHPFCDGNGRMARTLTCSQLFHSGFSKMKGISISSAINKNLGGYYRTLADSEQILTVGFGQNWIDITPFVSYMLDMYEQSMLDAVISENELTENETKLLKRMNHAGKNAEITVVKASKILQKSRTTAYNALTALVIKGYLKKKRQDGQNIYVLTPNATVDTIYQQNDGSFELKMTEVLDSKSLKKVSPILVYLKRHQSIKTNVAAELVGKSVETALRYIKLLVKAGILQPSGSTNQSEYYLCDDYKELFRI